MEFREYAASEVSSLIDRIVADADGRLEAQIQSIRREHAADVSALRLQLEAQIQELDARGQAKDQLAAAVTETRSQLDALRIELEAERAAVETQRALAETQRAEAEIQRNLGAANAEAAESLVEARALAAAQVEAERLTGQFETALEELRREHLETLQAQALARTVLPLDELLTVFGALANASTPSAVMTAVVSGLAREFSRVALFRLRGARLECVSHAGFEFEGDISKVVIPMSVDSLLTRAVNSRTTQSFLSGASEAPCSAPFGGTPACALALPLVSGEGTVAVIYADDSDQLEFGSVPSALLVKFAELVWQHAILVLQRASAAQKTLAVIPSQSFDRLA
jgi:hypothetical protein